MLRCLAGPQTRVLVGLERRPSDGAEAFFEHAEAALAVNGLEAPADQVEARA